jgi:phage/plasmid-associated DNA primase
MRIVINDHKQNPLAIHNKNNVDHKDNSSQNMGRDQPTESHIYTRDEHHDGTNMGRNQGTVTQNGEQIKPHKKQDTR